MIYRNMEIFNIAEIIELDDGAFTWRRVPKSAEDTLERGAQSLRYSRAAAGVELRFVLKGDSVTIRMAKAVDDGVDNSFHLFRGGFQGLYADYAKSKVLTDLEPHDIVITHVPNRERLELMGKAVDMGWDPNVIRIRFDRGLFKIYDIIGDIAPPTPEQCPKTTLMTYGSSITVGMDSMGASHAWASILAQQMRVDLRNIGFAGSCMLEPEVARYLGQLGQDNKWDLAILELGINALSFPEDMIYDRVRNILQQVAGNNPTKPVFVISPFHCPNDLEGGTKAVRWRQIIAEVIDQKQYPNVTYINGMDILGDVSWFAADGLHPSCYGHQKIAQDLYQIIHKKCKKAL